MNPSQVIDIDEENDDENLRTALLINNDNDDVDAACAVRAAPPQRLAAATAGQYYTALLSTEDGEQQQQQQATAPTILDSEHHALRLMNTSGDAQQEGLGEGHRSHSHSQPYDNPYLNNFYITIPWSPQVYFTVRGAENFHIILWIAKDISWTQDAYFPSMCFGIAALSWCLVLLYHAVSAKCITEVYMLVVMILWLSANFLWMSGEVFSGDDDQVVPMSSHIMEAAIGLVFVYHLILRPLNIITIDDVMNQKYEDVELYPRISYFRNWREYEHIHTVCWLGKDLSWNQGNLYTWCICVIPTVLIAIDFIWSSYKTKKMAIDCAHYVAMLIWVIGNGAWAMGDLVFVPYVAGYADDFTAYPVFSPSYDSIRTCRWWSTVILICALVPIFCLYAIWLPLTCSGKIKAADIPENYNIKRSSFSGFVVAVKNATKKKRKGWFTNVRKEYST